MPKPRRVTVTLLEDVVSAADEVASALVEDELRWYLRVQDLAWDEASPEELEAIERGRAEHTRGQFATLDEIRRNREADLLEQRTKESEKTSAE